MATSLKSALHLIVLGAGLSIGATQVAPPAQARVFSGARAIDPATGAATDEAILVVENGRVTALGRASTVRPPAGAERVDLAGKVVIPGLISGHVHISNVNGLGPRAYTDENTRRQLRVFARYGITSVVSLGGEEEPAFRARAAQSAPGLDRARIFVAGAVLAPPTAEAARQVVTTAAGTGASRPDFLKIRVDDNLGASSKMAPDVYRAIITEAHRLGVRVAAHIYYLDDAKDLLRAGVDMIAHSVRDRDIDDEFIALMKARNVPYCPTLTRELSTFVYESTPDFFSDPFFLREADRQVVADLSRPEKQAAMRDSRTAQAYKQALVVARRNLKRAADAGLFVVMGTDAGPFPERFQGFFEHVELAMMVESGMTPAQALRSATTDAARALRLDGVGTLSPGAWADFVVLDRDPLTDIRNTRTIHAVYVAGKRVE